MVLLKKNATFFKSFPSVSENLLELFIMICSPIYRVTYFGFGCSISEIYDNRSNNNNNINK